MLRLIAHIATKSICIFVVGKNLTKYFEFTKILCNSAIDMNVNIPALVIESGRVLTVNPAKGAKWTVSAHQSSMSILNPERHIILNIAGHYDVS
jgi:hypothetical protein